MNHLKVKDNDHLYRDVNTGAIINTDRSSFEKYKKSTQKFQNIANQFKLFSKTFLAFSSTSVTNHLSACPASKII